MAETKGVDLGLGNKNKVSSVLGSPPGEIDGEMNQGIADEAVGADIDPGSGSQSGSHPAKTQGKILRYI